MAQNEKILQYKLLENGIDSISHGIDHYIDGNVDLSKSKEARNFKYAILHIFQGIELILKEKLYCINRILIYSNIDTEINDSSYTVSFGKLGIRLQNAGTIFPIKWLNTLKEIQKVRNIIQHKEFSLDLGRIKTIIGESIEFLINFMRKELNIELKDNLESEKYELLIEMIGFYEERLKMAKEKVQEHFKGLSPKEAMMIEVLHCPECNHQTVVVARHGQDSSICYFCKENIEIYTCDRCGVKVLNASPTKLHRFLSLCDNCLLDWMDE